MLELLLYFEGGHYRDSIRRTRNMDIVCDNLLGEAHNSIQPCRSVPIALEYVI